MYSKHGVKLHVYKMPIRRTSIYNITSYRHPLDALMFEACWDTGYITTYIYLYRYYIDTDDWHKNYHFCGTHPVNLVEFCCRLHYLSKALLSALCFFLILTCIIICLL